MGNVCRWPLILIASPAAVAVWSGWVGLGQLCGFGIVRPLPGIAPGVQLDTAITLPVGVEAYGAYALAAWISLTAEHPARTFARRSAIGSLLLGALGQVSFHLLSVAHAARAPWPVTVLVACMPVVTLGFGTGLTHLLRGREADSEDAALPVTVPDLEAATPKEPATEPDLCPATAGTRPATATRTASAATVKATAAATAKAARPGQREREAATIVANNPSITGKELGRALGLSERTGRRILADLTVGT